MTVKQKNFVKGAAVLGLAGIVCKAIGAVFRIPLANIVGEVGMGNYQLAYPIYSLLLVVSTAGLPSAISKMVSERLTVGDYRGAHSVFKVAFKILLILGILTTLVMAGFSKPIAAALGRAEAWPTFMAIAPALFFVSILSAYRGYFQGMQSMTPTAMTQLVEQVFKLVCGLGLASMWIEKGPEYGAAGALAGVTLSEICALALIMGCYARKKKSVLADISSQTIKGDTRGTKSMALAIIKLAVPITLGACIMPFVSAIDSAIVIRSLTGIGYTNDNATAMFGLLTGYVNPLINMPAVLSLALSMSLVPAISAAKAAKDDRGMRQKASLGFRLAVLVGMPCAIGFYILSKPILMLLYGSLSGANLEITAALLGIMSIGVLFLTIVQTLTGILQGLGKVTVPVINLLIGAVVKLIVSIVLIRMPDINIFGAALGTVACYAIAAILDIVMVLKHSKLRFNVVNMLIKPVIATAIMGVATYFTYAALAARSNTIATLVSVVVAIVVYCIVLLLVKAIGPDDLKFIPGGGKLTKVMKKLKVWR